MTSLLVLLLSPLLCQGASVYEQDQSKVVHSGGARSQPIRSSQPEASSQPARSYQQVVNSGSQPSCPEGGSSDSSCSLMRSTMDLLKAASATAECPACDCDKAEAEETCMVYIASELLMCRDSSSDPDHQAACVRQELTSGYPAGLAPCSSDAALCTAIAKFAKITASTFALTCTDTKTIGDGLGVGITGDRQGRFLGLGFGHIITLIAAALASAGTNPLDKPSISCTAISPPALKLPCIFPFHQGEDGPQESVAGGVTSPVVHNGCATDDIVPKPKFESKGPKDANKKAIVYKITGHPAAMATIGLNNATPRWCATVVDAKAATVAPVAAMGSSIRGNAVNADRMIRWRYCGACIVV